MGGDSGLGPSEGVVRLEPRQLGLGEVFYLTGDAVIVAEATSGRIVVWNAAAFRLFGYDEQEAIGLLVEDLVHDGMKARHRAGLARYAREGRGDLIDSGSPVELPALHKDGRDLWVEMSLTPLRTAGLPGRYAMAIVRDTTERKELEVELQRARAELTATVEQLERRTRELTLINELGDLLHACATTEEAGGVISEMAGRLFPAHAGALYLFAPSRNILDGASRWGTPFGPDGVAPEDCWALRRGREHLVESAGQVCAHVREECSSSLCVPLVAHGETLGLLHIRAMPSAGPSTSVASVRDLAVGVAGHLALALANFRLRETLRNQSIRDPLTDLYNRRYMEESLEREVRRAGRHALSLSVIAIDIDHFKSFNDAYGHEAGDTLLQALAVFLHANVRGEDVVCRMGGEEFLAILPYASLDQATARAEQLRAGVKSLTVFPRASGIERSVTISLGVAAFPAHGSSGAGLLRAADAALYRAKAEGRDKVVLASD